MSWPCFPFGDFVTLQRGFDLTKSKMKGGKIPVIGSNCIIGFHNKSKVMGPGVITGRSGTLGVTQYIDRPYWPHNTALWVKDFKKNDPKFVFYKFKTLYLENFNGGASVPTLNRNALDTLQVEIPDIVTQRRIASILSTYDDLIENNRRQIQLLEQAAQLLYKEWFINLRFPGYEHAIIANGMPEGWEKMPLSDIADITMGQSPKSTYYNEDGNGLPFHQGVTNFGTRFPSHQTYCTIQSRLVAPGDILFSVRAPVGRINITMDNIVIGRGIAAIRSTRSQQNFLFYALKSLFFKEDLMGGGVIFAAITKKDLCEVKLVQPPDYITDMFIEHVQPIDIQIKTLQQEISSLTQARDMLLPRLMNGKIALSTF